MCVFLCVCARACVGIFFRFLMFLEIHVYIHIYKTYTKQANLMDKTKVIKKGKYGLCILEKKLEAVRVREMPGKIQAAVKLVAETSVAAVKLDVLRRYAGIVECGYKMKKTLSRTPTYLSLISSC